MFELRFETISVLIIFSLMGVNKEVARGRPEKLRAERDSNLVLCNAGAVLHHTRYQGNRELIYVGS